MEITPDQLRDELLNKKHPANIKINAGAVVIDAEAFLIVQFDIVSRHKGELRRCAAWQRLLEFREAVKEI
ncbi:DUF6965 family protein [Sphingobacterium corticis]|uniref:DUF6965 family protein n=1 Tax=Sphingobacterium corticis TaxID=1812823 RepID=A0ABW5NQR3_9SPHI